MAEEIKAGCDRPTGGPVGEKPEAKEDISQQSTIKEVKSMVKVGKKAPDFTAPAYQKGKFISVQLSEPRKMGRSVFLSTCRKEGFDDFKNFA